LPWKRPLSDREMNTKWNIYSYMPTNPENLVKIDSEIYLLQAIVEKKKER